MKTPKEIFNHLKERERLQFSKAGEALVVEAMEEYANQFKGIEAKYKEINIEVAKKGINEILTKLLQ